MLLMNYRVVIAGLGLIALQALPLAGGPLSVVGIDSALAAPGGNGNGNGGNDEKQNNGRQNRDDDGESSNNGKKPEQAEIEANGSDKPKNIHTQLAGLNSLNRNINGLMNSADPRMEGVRTFVEATQDLELALAEQIAANMELDLAAADLQTLIGGFALVAYDGDLSVYDEQTLVELSDRLLVLQGLNPLPGDPAYDELVALEGAIAAVNASAELVAYNDAVLRVGTADDAVATLEEATNDAALTEALLQAANDNRLEQYGDDYITPDILAWARAALGL